MIELFHFPKKFENWPDNANRGICRVLFHKVSDASLIIHRWINCLYFYKERLSIQIEILPKIPKGVYRVLTILFFKENENRHFLAVTNPFNFTLNDLLFDGEKIIDAPTELAAKEIEKWEKSISIGDKDNLKDIKYSEAHFVCSDCLLTMPVKVGPAELYPLSPSGIIDLSSSIKEAILFQGLRDIPFNEIAENILKQNDRRSPMFCMSFRRIYRDDKEFILPLLPYIKRIFGILCINRGAYPRLLGGIYLKQKDGFKTVYYMNLNSYYRGNLIGGSISKEKPEQWNEQYALSLSTPFKSEIMSKLNSAHAELDLDISYFRLWSIIESVSNAVFGDKKIQSIKRLIRAVYHPQDIEKTIKLKLGELLFTFNDLINMWLDWRNCTAHDGGIYSYYSGLRKVHPKIKVMIDEMNKLNLPVEFGEDRSLMVLRDVCTKVVEAFICDKIKII